MGAARDKLNVLYLLFCFGGAGLIGSIFNSGTVTTVALIVLIVVCINGRFLR